MVVFVVHNYYIVYKKYTFVGRFFHTNRKTVVPHRSQSVSIWIRKDGANYYDRVNTYKVHRNVCILCNNGQILTINNKLEIRHDSEVVS